MLSKSMQPDSQKRKSLSNPTPTMYPQSKRGSKLAAPVGHKAYNTNGEGGAPLIHDDEFIHREADAFEKWLLKEDSIYVKRFAFMRGYPAENLSRWAEKNKRFAQALSRAKEAQEIRLVEKGLVGEHKEKMSQFVLTNCHDWKTRNETEVTGTASLSVNVMHFGLPNTPVQPVAIDVTPSKELTCQPTVDQ